MSVRSELKWLTPMQYCHLLSKIKQQEVRERGATEKRGEWIFVDQWDSESSVGLWI